MILFRAQRFAKRKLQQLERYSPYPVFYKFEMSKNEKALFDRSIAASKYFLEFGIGGSTIRALQKSSTQIHSVESSLKWVSTIESFVFVRKYLNKRLHIHHVDIGRTKAWGFPVSEDDIGSFGLYSSSIFKEIDTGELDLVLIDGRFRVACTLKTILECHKNETLQILIHDLWNRNDYHIVLQYLEAIDKVDTLGLFRIKKDIDLKEVQRQYEAFKNNPD